MNVKAKYAWVVCAAVLFGAVVWLSLFRGSGPRSDGAQRQRPGSTFPVETGSRQGGPVGAETSRRDVDAQQLLRSFADELAKAQVPNQAEAMLQRLRSYLTGLPPEIAVTAVRAFLDGRTDVGTRLEFAIERNGQLRTAPSLRVWLLDCLGQIDRDAAAEYARAILSVPSSADEWAVSIRDYALARTSPQDNAFVRSKMREMIGNSAWQQKPSAGFLEAFDAIVYARATDLTPDLIKLVTNKENRAVAHAAYLTLDRLVLEDPQTMLAQLANTPEGWRGREQTRANYFARADVRDPQQRTILESYLLDPRRTPDELQTFAGIYPNASFMVSNNLLTKVNTPTQGELIAHDREALRVVNGWLSDARFVSLVPHLEQVHARLSTFVASRPRTQPGR